MTVINEHGFEILRDSELTVGDYSGIIVKGRGESETTLICLETLSNFLVVKKIESVHLLKTGTNETDSKN